MNKYSDINKNINKNAKEGDANKENNINNLSNINFLKTTREKEAGLFKKENVFIENNQQNFKTPNDSLKNDLETQLNYENQSSKKNPSTNDLSLAEFCDSISHNIIN